MRQGAAPWNQWREANPTILPDLAGAQLSKINLRDVNLSAADLSGANLQRATLVNGNLSGANLSSAKLARATLRDASLSNANLREVDLHHAELRGAHLDAADLTLANFRKTSLQNAHLNDATLVRTDFLGATLTGCDLAGAQLSETNFSDTSLAAAYGLDSCRHLAPSTIDHRTLDRSGALPRPFLEGCGLPGDVVDRQFAGDTGTTCRCFISYSHKDEELARKLRADLESRHIECFLACDDMLAGDKILERVHREIGERDRVLLLLSAASVNSEWVEREVKRALYEEDRRRRTVLVPIDLDNAIEATDEAWAMQLKIDREVATFSDWRDHQSYRLGLQKLVSALISDRDW